MIQRSVRNVESRSRPRPSWGSVRIAWWRWRGRFSFTLARRRLAVSAWQATPAFNMKCLAKEPSRRYASALEVAEELGAFLECRPIKARPVGALERLWLWSRRHPGLAAMGGLLAVAVAAGLGAFFWQSRENHFNLYAADLRIAAEDIEHGDLGRARALLAPHAPAFGTAPFTWR